MYNPCKVTVVIRFQICIFDILNTAKTNINNKRLKL